MYNEIFDKSSEEMFDDLMDSTSEEEERHIMTALIPTARVIMKSAFEKDPDFKRVYADNIAMLLYDYQHWGGEDGAELKLDSVITNNRCAVTEYSTLTTIRSKSLFDFDNKEQRDFIANKILDLIFG